MGLAFLAWVIMLAAATVADGGSATPAATVPTAAAAPGGVEYPWPGAEAGVPLAVRLEVPPGRTRVPVAPGSFAAWLRRLPLLPGRPPVHLFDGRLKVAQEVHAAILAVDVGRRDLQQCADAIIRLRAEWLWSRGCEDAVAFTFTSGSLAAWAAWREGQRPQVTGRQVTWRRRAPADASYASFRRYLDTVFTYAGTASLAKELLAVPDPLAVEGGDVFIQPGFPGHAVLVVDVATDPAGRRHVVLAQGFTPAQEIHVLRNPADPAWPWYRMERSGVLQTPEWRFSFADLRRFPDPGCP